MKLQRILLSSALTLSFTVSAPSTAHADPITASIVAFAGFTAGTTAAAIATFVVNSALYSAASLAVSKVSSALGGKGKQALQERQASVLNLSIGEVPREFVFGVGVTGGSLIDAFNWGGQYGTDNVTRCVALADHEIEALFGVIVDDASYDFTANGVQPGYGGKLRIDFVNATAAGSVPPSYVLQNSGGSWTASDRLEGIAHVWITYAFDEKIWTQGHPQFRFNFRGMRVYDPRRDPSLGYVGPNPNTWDDRSTHRYDANAALVRYAFTRGIYAEGHQGDPHYLLVGRGLSAEEAPPERIIAAANLCAEPIVEASGAPNIRYKAGGVIRASDDFIVVEEMFAAAMAGVIVQREGGVEIEPGHAKASVVTITDDDLVVGEGVRFSDFLPDTDGGRINTVLPRFISPAQGFVDHGGPVRRSLADIAEDGGPRELTLSLPLVFEGDQADRCAEIIRRLARLERRATIVLPPEYAFLEEGDWVAWQSDLNHGGATVRYRIESWSLDRAWRMRLSLREIASSVYGAPDPAEDLAEPPPPPVPIDALALLGVTAEAILLQGETSVIPAIRLGWSVPVDPATRAVRAEVRIQGQDEVAPTRADDVAAGVMIVTNGVAASQTLEARLVPIADASRPVLPSAWITVTTGNLVADDVIVPGGRRLSEVFDETFDFENLQEVTESARLTSATLIREALERWNRTRDEKIAAIEREEVIAEDLVSTRETLIVADANALALIETVNEASISRDAAETSTRELQVSVLNGNVAALDFTTGTLATNLAAETFQRETAVSSLGGQIASVQTNVTTLATALTAETETRSTQYSQTQSTLSAYDSRITTNATATSANATAITTLGASVGTLSGTITTVQAAQVDLDGRVDLLYGFSLNNNGRIAGMYAANNGAISIIDFEFDVFRIWSGSASVPMFAVDSGSVYIAGNRVNTASITANAVSNGASSRTTGSVLASTPTEVQTCGITAAGGRIRVDFSVNLAATSLIPEEVVANIVRNGTTVWTGVIGQLLGVQRLFLVIDGGGADADSYVDIPGQLNSTACLFFVDGGPVGVPGEYFYQLFVECGLGVSVSERNMVLTELKR